MSFYTTNTMEEKAHQNVNQTLQEEEDQPLKKRFSLILTLVLAVEIH